MFPDYLQFCRNIGFMDNKNTKKSILLPILLALSLSAGIAVGFFLRPETKSISSGNGFSSSNFFTGSKVNAVIQLINENYVEQVSVDSLEELAIPKILEALDPHTSYIPAEELKQLNEPLRGNFEGIGVQFNIHNDTVLIVNTIAGGPSEKVGVQAGDRIIKVNDSLFAGTGITNKDVMKKLKGEAGSTVKISVKRQGVEGLIDFKITRDKIPLHSIEISYMLNDNIGYIKISSFSATTHNEFLQAAEKLLKAGMKKMVLDLRQNGGGYLNAAVDIADEFLDKDKMIVYTEGQARPKREYHASETGICEDIELAVLIDSWSASASEIVAGAVQDNDRGIIIGRRSYGKGLVQEPFMFKDGSGVRITIARYYTPTGRCIQRPYENGKASYYADIFHRAADGELINADSIKINDSLKYTTPGGKVVYGGGGITPDVFIPNDTTYFNDYMSALVKKGLIYNFAIQYTDEHRTELSEFTKASEIENYLKSQNLLTQFINYTQKNGVEKNEAEFNAAKDEIYIRLKAYIARNILDEMGYYPIIHKKDKEVKKAIEKLK